ncbi:dihydrolipoyl dehydrogenase family protein [Thermasporomyces composti]|jgi:dihydrolipoamide dehydrogenase|uniref:Dihydrolipoamide dehydrogenase n=1 Tax=Thermasporomyces composti TaxID=696763 RepID=A0A3D9V982_THECX|nr:NAD(P)/FAD-dependent oxidoreductase [Thermasporomyces composti]REF36720.1 dihydrolipoamide dehydrogenase [Thermasporomyces composti]
MSDSASEERPHTRAEEPPRQTGAEQTPLDRTYDVVVIGGGAVGENVAARVVQRGLSALLIEQELLGGECSYWACMPSKALLRPGEVLRAARAVPGAAQAVTGDLDVRAVLERRDAFTSNWNDSSQVRWAEQTGITVARGRGRLDGPRRVVVQLSGDTEERPVEARHAVVLCTGSQPSIPPIPGLRELRPWTSREATSAKEVPKRLAIVGGGVVGCEMAQAWARLGSQVVLLERGERVLEALEPFVGDLLADALRADGVDVRTGVALRSASREGEGPVTLATDDGEITADTVLVATGRAPRTAGLGLETVGLEPDARLDVDDSCRVTAVEGGWLYAAGDVNGRALFTHQGKYQARMCGDAIAARARGEHASPVAWSPFAATADHHAVPAVVFTDPQVATVGYTEAQARDEGISVRAVEHDLGQVAGAALRADGYTGRAKLVVDQERLVVVGFTAVGPEVGELLHAATVAIVGEVPLDRLWHAVPAFPTVSEVWLRLLEAYGL